MTEDEAKTKWCPMTAPLVIVPHYASQAGSCNCVGSACMMWRWTYTPEEAKGNKNGPQGICGMAGPLFSKYS
jgi:hypothetical protein